MDVAKDKKTSKVTFRVDGQNFGKFKLRDKGRRMKLYIKLSKEDTQQWLTLKEALTGGEITDQTLARIIFFKGIHSITQELNERIENMSDEEKKEIMEKMSAAEADEAMHIAEEEFGVSDEEAEENNNG